MKSTLLNNLNQAIIANGGTPVIIRAPQNSIADRVNAGQTAEAGREGEILGVIKHLSQSRNPAQDLAIFEASQDGKRLRQFPFERMISKEVRSFHKQVEEESLVSFLPTAFPNPVDKDGNPVLDEKGKAIEGRKIVIPSSKEIRQRINDYHEGGLSAAYTDTDFLSMATAIEFSLSIAREIKQKHLDKSASMATETVKAATPAELVTV